MDKKYTELELEEFATALRKKLDLPPGGKLSIHDFVARCISRTEKLTLEIVDDLQNERYKGQSQGSKHLIRLPRKTFENALAGCPISSFVVCEEFCHYFLGHTEIRNNLGAGQLDHHARNNPKAKWEEKEAKYAAGALLAPIAAFENSADKLAESKRLGLSNSAAHIRSTQAAEALRILAGNPKPLPAKLFDFAEEAARRGITMKHVPSRPQEQPTPLQNPINPVADKLSKAPGRYLGCKCMRCRTLTMLEDTTGVLSCIDCGWPSDDL